MGHGGAGPVGRARGYSITGHEVGMKWKEGVCERTENREMWDRKRARGGRKTRRGGRYRQMKAVQESWGQVV